MSHTGNQSTYPQVLSRHHHSSTSLETMQELSYTIQHNRSNTYHLKLLYILFVTEYINLMMETRMLVFCEIVLTLVGFR